MIINANALHIPLATGSIHCIVTSPPYWGLRDYGVGGQLGLERTQDEYIANMVAVFRECWRVLRDDGTCWVNVGDSYASGKGSCFNPGGGESSYKDYRKDAGVIPLQRLNISEVHDIGLKPKDLVGIPWRLAFALQADGWYLRSDIIWSKPNPMPESVTDRPTKAHEYLFLLAKRERYYYDADAVREEYQSNSFDRTNNQNDTYGTGKGGTIACNDRSVGATNPAGRNRRTVWTIPTHPYPGAHFATFPPALVEPCIKAGTSERGCCPKCGKGWRRDIDKESHYEKRQDRAQPTWKGAQVDSSGWEPPTIKDNGWQPSCTCDANIEHDWDNSFLPDGIYGGDRGAFIPCKNCETRWYFMGDEWEEEPVGCISEPIPSLVFDPFVGSGTTVKVAYDLGRRGVGIDLSLKYLDEQARTRVHNGHVARLI